MDSKRLNWLWMLLRPDFIVRGTEQYTCRIHHNTQSPTSESSSLLLFNTFQPLVSRTQLNMSKEARKLLLSPNAGGSSEWSEAVSFELLRVLLGVDLLHTEMELEYTPGSKITDYSIRLFGQTIIGVSVTRALKFSLKGEKFTEEDGVRLLRKKLNGVNESTRGVLDHHKWSKQFLHIFAQTAEIAQILKKVYLSADLIDAELRSNTIVIVTTTIGKVDWIYYNFDDYLEFAKKKHQK